jgi:hypothetical protein
MKLRNILFLNWVLMVFVLGCQESVGDSTTKQSDAQDNADTLAIEVEKDIPLDSAKKDLVVPVDTVYGDTALGGQDDEDTTVVRDTFAIFNDKLDSILRTGETVFDSCIAAGSKLDTTYSEVDTNWVRYYSADHCYIHKARDFFVEVTDFFIDDISCNTVEDCGVINEDCRKFGYSKLTMDSSRVNHVVDSIISWRMLFGPTYDCSSMGNMVHAHACKNNQCVFIID